MKRTALIFALVFALSSAAAAQTTAFNFQGRLNDGTSPANGRYDLQFRLYDALTGDNQIGAAITKANTMLVNGIFSTQLDFGAAAFSGADRFIEIRLRSAGTENGYVILGPRQQILSVPYSVKSLNATNAQTAVDSTNAINATNAVNAANATNAVNAQTAVNSQQLGGVAASQYVQKGSIITPKVIVKVRGTTQAGTEASIVKCYNGTLTGTAATTPPCGFTLNNFTPGGYGINFGFDVRDYFVSLAAEKAAGSANGQFQPNVGIYYMESLTSQTNLDVRTYFADDRDTTSNALGFTIILY